MLRHMAELPVKGLIGLISGAAFYKLPLVSKDKVSPIKLLHGLNCSVLVENELVL